MLHVNFLASYANSNDALIPELWARESIAVLEENMVMGMLVHRDFENEIRDFGDVVNTRKPADMVVRRKTDSDTITYNDAVVTNVQVPLNQHFYAGFVIKDGERSKSMQDLIAVHLVPAMKAMGNGIDRAILGRVAHELLGSPSERVGRLDGLTSSNAKDFVLEVRERLNRQLASTSGRRLVLAPGSETALLQTDLFISAERRGDGGVALEEARLGRILGFDTFMDQNVNGILAGSANGRDVVLGAATAAIAAGATGSQTGADVTGYAVIDGEFVNLAGNDQPTWATAATDNGTDTTAITFNEATKYDVASGAVITVYKAADVDGTYAAGYTKEIVIDGHTSGKNLVVGQLLAFGQSTGTRHTYTVIEVISSTSTSTSVLLDRPLDASLANNDKAFPGPAGDFNLAFERNAVALVTRPLARADESSARSFVAVHNDIAMRATMQYDIDVGGTKIVLDILAGVAVLDERLATLLLG